MRCFVAVDLPDDVRAAVAAVQTDARAAAPRADVAWVDSGQAAPDAQVSGRGRGRRGDRRARRARGGSTPARAVLRPLPVVRASSRADRGRGCSGVGLTAALREMGLLAAEVERAYFALGFPLDRATLSRPRHDRPRGARRAASRARSPRWRRRLPISGPGRCATSSCTEAISTVREVRCTSRLRASRSAADGASSARVGPTVCSASPIAPVCA